MSNISLDMNLNEITKFRLDEINKVKEYLNNEIKERKIALNKISKYVIIFDYTDKIFITLPTSFGTLSIVSHVTVVGIPVGVAGASLTLICTVATGIVKKMLNVTRKQKKKHDKIITLAKNKLSIVETLISESLIDFDISHDEYAKIIDEKVKYENIKENIRSINSHSRSFKKSNS